MEKITDTFTMNISEIWNTASGVNQQTITTNIIECQEEFEDTKGQSETKTVYLRYQRPIRNQNRISKIPKGNQKPKPYI